MEKTNAMRILERGKAPYSVRTYDGGALSGVEVARSLGEDVDRVYKTLVTVGSPRKYYVFVIPVAAELDLKKAAKAAGGKGRRNASAKGTLSAHGLHPRRLFAARNEKALSDLFPSGRAGQGDLCQRGKGGDAGGSRLCRPSAPDGRNARRPHAGLTRFWYGALDKSAAQCQINARDILTIGITVGIKSE